MVSDFNKKGNREAFKQQLLLKIGGVFLIFFVLFMIVQDIKIYRKKQELLAQINTYKKQIEEIKTDSQKLKNQITNAGETDYLEKLGYEQFGQAKPGETEYMFVKAPAKTPAPVAPKNAWEAFTSWVSGIFNWSKSKN